MSEKRFSDLNDLQAIIEELEQEIDEQQSIISALNEENEQLRQQLEIRTESDKYHQRMLMKWLCKDE